MAAWCSSPVRPGPGRRRWRAASPTGTGSPRGSCGARATRCSRRARSARCSTSPSTPAATSRRSPRAGADPHDVAVALLRELARRPPTVLVLEDLHWADEATLDVLRLLARKVGLGAGARRRHLPRRRARAAPSAAGRARRAGHGAGRSLAASCRGCRSPAVAQLAEPHGIDAGELYRRTAGNPFFVTEVWPAATATIPPTVRDAVLARAARLSADGAPRCSSAVAVVPAARRAVAARALAGEDELACLDECLGSGMLRRPRRRRLPPRARARGDRGGAGAAPPGRRCTGAALAALAAPPAGARRARAPGPPRRGGRRRRRRAAVRARRGRARGRASAPTARRPRSTRARCASPADSPAASARRAARAAAPRRAS